MDHAPSGLNTPATCCAVRRWNAAMRAPASTSVALINGSAICIAPGMRTMSAPAPARFLYHSAAIVSTCRRRISASSTASQISRRSRARSVSYPASMPRTWSGETGASAVARSESSSRSACQKSTSGPYASVDRSACAWPAASAARARLPAASPSGRAEATSAANASRSNAAASSHAAMICALHRRGNPRPGSASTATRMDSSSAGSAVARHAS